MTIHRVIIYQIKQGYSSFIIVPKIVGKFFRPDLLGFLARTDYNKLWIKSPTTEFGTVTHMRNGMGREHHISPVRIRCSNACGKGRTSSCSRPCWN